MLTEVQSARQVPGEPFRRWYTDTGCDLVVWIEKHRIIGFQLATDDFDGDTVVTWHEGHSLTVDGLDDGERRAGRPKMTPVLTQARTTDLSGVLSRFKTISRELPAGLPELVLEKIEEHQAKDHSEQSVGGDSVKAADGLPGAPQR